MLGSYSFISFSKSSRKKEAKFLINFVFSKILISEYRMFLLEASLSCQENGYMIKRKITHLESVMHIMYC